MLLPQSVLSWKHSVAYDDITEDNQTLLTYINKSTNGKHDNQYDCFDWEAYRVRLNCVSIIDVHFHCAIFVCDAVDSGICAAIGSNCIVDTRWLGRGCDDGIGGSRGAGARCNIALCQATIYFAHTNVIKQWNESNSIENGARVRFLHRSRKSQYY